MKRVKKAIRFMSLCQCVYDGAMLQQLTIHALRNLNHFSEQLHPKLNLICGENGSGKSSILEAIYLLGLGRSFRARQAKHMIQHEASALGVTGEIKTPEGLTHNIKIKRTRNKEGNESKINDHTIASLSELAQHLPIQLLEPQSFELLSGSPETRRQFMDWGVFHHEHDFFQTWQKVQRLIKQRNAMLKQQASQSALSVWNQELVRYGQQLDLMRLTYLEAITPYLDMILSELIPEMHHAITLKYYQGWSHSQSLEEALHQHFVGDSMKGYTQVGPHRASVQLTYKKQPAQQILSKGQQKCVVTALKLAQTELFHATSQQACLFLLDDLAAELDHRFQARIAERLFQLPFQLFVTCIEKDHLKGFFQNTPEHQELQLREQLFT